MKALATKVKFIANLFGINLRILFQQLTGLPKEYLRYRLFLRLRNPNDNWPIDFSYPICFDRRESAGTAQGQYFLQDIHVARKVFQNNPQRHIDVGSRIDGFVAHVASFREIEVLDIRNLKSHVKEIKFTQANLFEAPQHLLACADSVSCLHALEHFGLGRYGDPLDPTGHIKGLESLRRLLKPGGILYLSVPFGRRKIEFNAHRIFDTEKIKKLLDSKFTNEEITLFDDSIGRINIESYEELTKLEGKVSSACVCLVLRLI
ncbi:MAG: hypothetical protein RL189_1044 [Pseudomonadota bacterium]|jgi:SAM-dependent methyltransferase